MGSQCFPVRIQFSHESLLRDLPYAQVYIEKNQAAFMKRKSTTDQIFMLRVALEEGWEHKINTIPPINTQVAKILL